MQGAGGTIGNLVGSNFQISDSTDGRAAAPAVAFDPVNDQFLVVWGDDRGGPAEERDIWGQLVDSNGNDVGGNFQISSQSGLERAPAVRYHPEQQEYLAVWSHSATFGAQADVNAQRVSPNGTLLGSQIDVAATGDQEGFGDFAINGHTGSYVIPLTTGPTVTDRNTVEMVKLNAAGTPVGTRQQVSTDTAANKGPTAAVFGSTPVGPGAGTAAVSEVFLAWRDARSDVGDLVSQDVFGRMVEVLEDTDGDGLLDTWEEDGYVDMNDNGVLDAGDFDFSTLPAANQPDPDHKDIYVEVDWMDCAEGGCAGGDTHDHAMVAGPPGSTPTGTPLDLVINVFDNAPVSNPDGNNGINLHIDVGQMGGGGPIPETLSVDFFATNSFEAVKAANFNPIRERVFHYALRKHEGSGRAEIWGNDFWWRYTTQTTQATGFMHELGHNLGLRHGGGDNTNCKPNYFSIMSYTHQLQGIPAGMRIDYSQEALPTLDESNLDETDTLGDGDDQATFSVVSDGSVSTVGPSADTAGNVQIDWDDDGTAGESGSDVDNNDLNRFDQCNGSPAAASPNQTMNGFDDWANIRYDFHSSPNFDDGVHTFIEEDGNRTPLIDFWRDHFGPPSLSMEKTGTASGIPGDSVTYEIEVTNSGPGPARNIIVEDTWPAGLTFTGSTPAPLLNELNPDGSRTLTWSFDLLDVGVSLGVTLNGTIDFPPIDTSVTNEVEVTGHNVLGEVSDELTDDVTTEILFPELELEKTAPATVNAGEAIAYKITYENVGTADAVGVEIQDTLPDDVYYSLALDLGAGPQPDSVINNPDGTTTLIWDIGAVPVGSGEQAIEYTARPSLLLLAGDTVTNDAALDFTDANGNDYPAVTTSATTEITVVEPSEDPRSLGFWRNHEARWSAELLARIQATDDRFDGADGSTPDGALSASEVEAVFAPGGNMPKVLLMQLLATYFNLADRRINAGTAIESRLVDDLGLNTVGEAVVFAQETLSLPVDRFTRRQYSQANRVLDEINNNQSEVY